MRSNQVIIQADIIRDALVVGELLSSKVSHPGFRSYERLPYSLTQDSLASPERWWEKLGYLSRSRSA